MNKKGLKYKLRVFLRSLVVVIAIAFILAIASILLINSEKVKNAIVGKIEESFECELEVKEHKFDLFERKANLSGVIFHKQQENEMDLVTKVESLEVTIRLIPLIFRHISFRDIIINNPKVTFTKYQEQKKEEQSIKKVEGAVVRAFLNTFFSVLEKIVELIFSLIFGFTSKPGYQIYVDNLRVNNGSVDICILDSQNIDVFKANISEIQYTCRELNPKSVRHFLQSADIEALINSGEGSSRYSQHLSSIPYAIDLKDFDLEYFSRLGNEEDALVIRKGLAGLSLKNRVVELNLRNLELEKNSEAKYPDFMFVAVDKLVERVKENNNELSFSCELNLRNMNTSDDIHFVVGEVFKGFAVQARERYGDEAVNFVQKKGKKGKEFFLEKRKKLDGLLRSLRSEEKEE